MCLVTYIHTYILQLIMIKNLALFSHYSLRVLMLQQTHLQFVMYIMSGTLQPVHFYQSSMLMTIISF